MRFGLGYPAPSDEARIVLRQPARTTLHSLKPVMDIATIIELQARVDAVKIDTALVDYILQLASATREHDDLLIGISPRGSIAMAQAARATAVLDDRDYCVPEDIVSNVLQVCAHRVISKSAMHDGDTSTTRRIMQQVLETIQSPA
jgi:MoxR-like ATPase